MGDFIPHGALGTDPNLFALSWPAIIQILAGIVILSFLVERALSILFESELFVRLTHPASGRRFKNLKPLIAFVVSAVICVAWGIDAISVVFLQAHSTILGCIVTGAVVAGGSKASLKIFREVLNVESSVSRDASTRAPATKKN